MEKLQGRIHFIGIGGAGMSAIAKILLQLGYSVSGSDIKLSPITKKLEGMGAVVYEGHQGSNVEGAGTVVISTAINLTNPELIAAKELGITVLHRADVLAEIMQPRHSIAVAGAHGKTTTTSMIALVLEYNKLDPTVIVGGELSYIGGNAKLGQSNFLVAEADESDGSFLKLTPKTVVITNIEDDHLDHYGTLENIMQAFREFASKVADSGTVVCCTDDSNVRQLINELPNQSYITYGLNEQADYTVQNIQIQGTNTAVDVYYQGQLLGKLELQVPGMHNLVNALAAVAVGREAGLDFADIANALGEFRGVSRRFQTMGDVLGVRIVDDYAHHPTEIHATLNAARSAGFQRVVAVFQPHRYSRTKFLYKEFGKVFGPADEIIINDIYAACELPIEGVSANLIVDEIEKNEGRSVHYIPTLEDTVDYLAEHVQPGDIVLTMGAGNVWTVGTKLNEQLMMKEANVCESPEPQLRTGQGY